jgi:hypothetical protein
LQVRMINSDRKLGFSDRYKSNRPEIRLVKQASFAESASIPALYGEGACSFSVSNLKHCRPLGVTVTVTVTVTGYLF